MNEMFGMTVGKLKRELEYFSDEDFVLVPFDTKNYVREIVAKEIVCVNEGLVEWSDYLQEYRVVTPSICLCEGDCQCEENTQRVIFLE